ncbi:MAG: cyclic nucleotide-binding domain-containing protein, partial [Amphiplicatus sp.]
MSATPLATEPEIDGLTAALSSAAPFSDLPQPVLNAIGDVSIERVFTAGETIVSLGQYDGGEFYFVLRGKLKAAFADEATRAMLIEEVPQGRFFGLADAIAEIASGTAERLTLTAEADSTVISIESAPFRAIVAQRPSLTRSLMHYFARALSAYGFRDAPGDSPVRRVFAALMEHIERDAVTGAWR